jgi:hypothetical protein
MSEKIAPESQRQRRRRIVVNGEPEPIHERAGAHSDAKPEAVSMAAKAPVNGEVRARYEQMFGRSLDEIEVSQPRDPLEREAAAIADQMVAAPVAAVSSQPASGGGDGPAPPAVLGLGPGRPLDREALGHFERRFGSDFGGVRVHTDAHAARTARALNARAYTVGQQIVFRDSFAPEHAEGQRLLAHELAHVVQQRGSAVGARPLIQRDGDPDHPDVVDPTLPVKTEQDELAPKKEFTYRIASSEPQLFIVPGDITRPDIAEKLLGDRSQQGAFEFVLTNAVGVIDGVPERAVRVRDSSLLTAEAQSKLFAALDKALDSDESTVIGILMQGTINDADEWKMVDITLQWSQRSDIIGSAGDNYFDLFLGRLVGHTLTQPHWYTLTLTETKHNGLDWLLIETEEKSDQISKALFYRSKKWKTVGFSVSGESAELTPGTIVGRFFWANHSGVQVYVAETIVTETSMERAETATRNARSGAARLVVPGGDGKFYGYIIGLPPIDPLLPLPDDDPGGHFAWYIPGSILIRPNETRVDFPEGTPGDKAQRSTLLAKAMASSTPPFYEPLLSLDMDVLASATEAQRVEIFKTLLPGGSEQSERLINFLARVMMSVPASEFNQFERELSDQGVMKTLIDRAHVFPALARVFTLKALAAAPIGAAAFAKMESFQVGEDAGGISHYAFGEPVEVDSTTVAGADWDPMQAPTVGKEPALPGQPAGSIKRSAIKFLIGSKAGLTSNVRTDRVTRPLLPTELMRVDVVSASSQQTVFVTALEAVSLGFSGVAPMLWKTGKGLANVLLWANAGAGLLKAFGPAIAEGLAAGSLSTGLGELVVVGTSAAGKKALYTFAYEAALLGGNQIVDAYREEWSKTEAGRVFLGIWDVGMAMLVARDVFKLLNSGIVTKVAEAGWAAVATLSGAARTGAARVAEVWEAVKLAASRMTKAELAEAEAATTAGPTMSVGTEGSLAKFNRLYASARVEVAGKAVTKLIGDAGRSTESAQAVLTELEKLAAGNKEMSKAATQLAHAAAGMSAADADAFLAAVKAALSVPGRDAGALAGFLRVAAQSAKPLEYLGHVQWLLKSGVSNDAIAMLSAKAGRGKVDLAWLRSTGLSDAQISFLGADEQTKWNFIMEAVASGDPAKLNAVRSMLRGAAAEMAASEMVGTDVLPGYKIVQPQASMGDSIIDFLIANRSGMKYALEIKGFTGDTWRRALKAWAKMLKEGEPALTDDELSDVKMLRRVLKQLKDAEASTKRPPFLGVTTDLSGKTQESLESFLIDNAPKGTEVVPISEEKIKAASSSLRKAVGYTEPGAVPGGGTP